MIFRPELALLRHLQSVHESVFPFSSPFCDVCGSTQKDFKHSSNKRGHVFTEHAGYIYECPLCAHRTKSLLSWRHHLFMHRKNHDSLDKIAKTNEALNQNK